MAVSPSSPATLEIKPENSESENPIVQLSQPNPSSSATSSSESSAVADNSNPPIAAAAPPLVPHQSFAPPPSVLPGAAPPGFPSFRPVSTPPQFSPVPNPNPYPNPNVQSQGVSIMLPGAASGAAGSVTVSMIPIHGGYLPPPGLPPDPAVVAVSMGNGFAAGMVPQGTIPPPGIPRYPTPYPGMVRPAFPPRPPGAIGVIPPLSRPPVPGIRGVPPIIPPVVRPVIPIVAPTEKPQTTVYVGKISPTVENDFMLSLLRLCGPVKSWKRAQDPSNGAPRGFGFCEFESAEGVLRALRLLSKFNVDGQELVLNVNQATKEYLERYVEKKTEREKLKESESDGIEKEEETAPGVEKKEPPKPPVLDSKKEENETSDKRNQDSQNFGIVTDEDREADRDALEKLRNMVEERLRNKPLPPPPAQPPADGSAKANSEAPTKSRDGADSDVDIMRSDAADDKNDDETTSENKTASEHEKPDASSPDRNRRHDKKSRDRDLKREKERELERYERERERERVRREREREMKIREAERLYKERLKEWESRERDKEHQRQHEKEREKDRERERRREIMDQEDESDDDSTRKRRRRSSMLEEKRKKRQRENEEDMDDRLREEEEIAAAKRRAIEEEQQKQKDETKRVLDHMINGGEETMMVDEAAVEEGKSHATEQLDDESLISTNAGEALAKSDIGDGSSDLKLSSSAPARKLGFGLVGSGKRTTVPSVFNEEDEDDAEKEKKMRPLVPIDYSTEELQAVQTPVSGATPSNLAAAAEFAKRISNVNQKEERSEGERERNRRSNDRSTLRDRDRNDEENTRGRDENKEKTLEREHSRDKLKTPENKKLLDAKQLIDMIPKTKEELFSYEINWAVYDKHELHERMRPWISKKITEFLGEEEATLVDYIVSSTKDHVRASQMLEQLQSILDDEAEMFVLKMWRMLIFEIKKVETGLSLKPKA